MKVKYVVVHQARLVKCILSHTRLDVIKSLDRMDCSYPYESEDNYLLPDQFVGIARCSENDVWNPEIGKRVAYDKARAKLDRSLFKRLQRYVDDKEKTLDEAVFRINALGRKISMSAQHRADRINEFFPVENDVVFTPAEEQ